MNIMNMETNSNNMHKAQALIDSMGANATVRRVKKDNSLLERSANENKIIIAEDNRQVLFG